VLLLVVRVFPDPHVEHVEGSVDPIRDIRIISDELRLKDMEQMHVRVRRLARGRRQQWSPALAAREQFELSVLIKAHEWLRAGNPLRSCRWTAAEAKFLGTLQMWTAKPVCVVLNMSARQYACPTLRKDAAAPVRAYLADTAPDCGVVCVSVALEEARARCKGADKSSEGLVTAVAMKMGEKYAVVEAEAGADKEKEKEKAEAGKVVKEKREKRKEKAKAEKDVGKSVAKAVSSFGSELLDGSGGFGSFLGDIGVEAVAGPGAEADKGKSHRREHKEKQKKNKPSHSHGESTPKAKAEVASSCECETCVYLSTMDDDVRARVDAIAAKEDGDADAEIETDAFSTSQTEAPADAADTDAASPSDGIAGKTLVLDESSALTRLLRTGYGLVRLRQCFVAYPQLVKGFMVPWGCRAPEAAARVYYDLANTFVSCEVCNFADWHGSGDSMSSARERGLVKTHGKQYEVQDGDILILRGVNKNKLHA
jgi:ribosome-binding ATPase YchF (GTP1/OBG family)